uniref:Uncharacterized protein n=1 Tax=Equus asinus asinus TaxID=83772 RepID=A0A8C4LXN9_EQUAS
MAESLPLEILTYILSFLPLSDQKRGLPHGSGLVLCSPECPSGGKVPPLSWPIFNCLSLHPAHGSASTSSICSCMHTYSYSAGTIQMTKTWSPPPRSS